MMTLEGAINLNETNDYIIYTMNSVTTGQYGVVVPKNINGTLNMLVDLHMKGSFDGVGNGTKTREQLISEISDEYNKVKSRYADGMLVMPMIDEVLFQSIVANGDKQKMIDEVKKIGAITSELYKKLTDQGIEKRRIDQKIIIVEKSLEDEKFVAWLKEQNGMANFVDGVLYRELGVSQVNANPFVDSNSIFGPAPVAPSVTETTVSTPASTIVGGGIFDNVSTVAQTTTPVLEPVQPVTPVETVVAGTPAQPTQVGTDIFGNAGNTVRTPAPAPVAPNVDNNVFGPSAASTVPPVVPTAPTQTPVVEGPKPVQSSSLDGTMAFSPVSEQNVTNNVQETEEDGGSSIANKSKGFVNLLILLVVLVGVTIVSIELGKYLYSVYGA